MCDSCPTRADKLRDLMARFEAMANEETDPQIARRLRRTVEDLALLGGAPAAQCNACAGDVVWSDAPLAVRLGR